MRRELKALKAAGKPGEQTEQTEQAAEVEQPQFTTQTEQEARESWKTDRKESLIPGCATGKGSAKGPNTQRSTNQARSQFLTAIVSYDGYCTA